MTLSFAKSLTPDVSDNHDDTDPVVNSCTTVTQDSLLACVKSLSTIYLALVRHRSYCKYSKLCQMIKRGQVSVPVVLAYCKKGYLHTVHRGCTVCKYPFLQYAKTTGTDTWPLFIISQSIVVYPL